MITVTLYTRADCRLCEEVKNLLAELAEKHPHRLVEIDIESDPALASAYGEQVPVLEIGPYKLRAPIERQRLKITLAAARDRIDQLEAVQDARYEQVKNRATGVSRADRFTRWFANRYLLVFNLLVFFYVGLPFLAPVLMASGARRPGLLIYRAYGAVCHQFAFRSWFLFGEQPAYPRAAAGVDGLIPYGQATGLDEGDIFAARQFVGNDQVGYKVAYCERDVAIYLGILVFGLLFAATRRRLPKLRWYYWILLGIAPIALDGFSQLLSQPPFSFWPYRESTPALRSLTGFLFGFSTAWFGYPQVEESMRETRRIMAVKFARAAPSSSPSAG